MWVGLALLCAGFVGTSDALTKRLLSPVKSDERFVGWAKLLFSFPWLLLALWKTGCPPLTGAFFVTMAWLIPVDLAAYFCYLRGIRRGPLSLTVPFLAVTPLATVLTGWLILGEQVTPLGFLGVLVVTVGAYVLQLELAAQGLLEPIKAIFRTPASRSMLTAALIYSVGATLSKRAIQLSSPTAFPFFLETLEMMFLVGLARSAVGDWRGFLPAIRSQWTLYLLSGMVTSAAILLHAYGILLAPVAYFIAIKRLSLFVSVLYGGLLFGEAKFLQRIVGAGLMLSGAVLIILTA